VGNILDLVNRVYYVANNSLDLVFLWVGLVVILAGYPIYYIVGHIRKSKLGELVRQITIVAIMVMVVGFFWWLPQLAGSYVATIFPWTEIIAPKFDILLNRASHLATLFRWIEIAIAGFFLARLGGKEYGENRWFQSWLGHFGTIFLGLLVGRWMGIFFISMPLLAGYYWSLYNLAIIILPTSDPENRLERWMRFCILVSYTWGIQSPLYITNENSWGEIETRIPGDFTWDFSDFPIPLLGKLKLRPGMVWTRSHQVVSISGGTIFKRVDGPGVCFIGPLERPDQVFDLRLQLRTNKIDVVSKDGVGFKAVVFAGFRLDNEDWDDQIYDKLRLMNSLLRGGRKLTHTVGSFRYSHIRVQAALGTTGTKISADNLMVYWDQWALNVVEDHARKVISQKNLNELWRPEKDKQFANALDIIANEIRENAGPILRAAGILLVVSRVVNLDFTNGDEKADDVLNQQLATWASEWKKKCLDISSKAQAESEHAQQEAQAYAEQILLNSVADGLQKAHEMHPRIPRYVIAMRFLTALQEYIHQSAEGKQDANQEKFENINDIRDRQDPFPPNHDVKR